jgi:Flp pilus assembly protein TadG
MRRTMRHLIERYHSVLEEPTRVARRGQAAFEFALMLPLFVIFVLLMIDFAMLTYQYVSLANAVREGARWGAVGCGANLCNQADIRTRTIDRSGGILDGGDASDVTVGWNDVDNSGAALMTTRDAVVVSVNHPYNFLFVPGAAIPVVACADMRIERRHAPGDLAAIPGCAS